MSPFEKRGTKRKLRPSSIPLLTTKGTRKKVMEQKTRKEAHPFSRRPSEGVAGTGVEETSPRTRNAANHYLPSNATSIKSKEEEGEEGLNAR